MARVTRIIHLHLTLLALKYGGVVIKEKLRAATTALCGKESGS